jgi:predicted Ser/Thr protein kinase
MKAALATGTADGQERATFIPPTIEELGPKFPHLEILELLGRGGMGAVYKARQKELDRFVALKILPPGIGRDAAFADRFTREARALARLNHPGIITIHDFGRADGLYFFVMEYVDGVNLRQLLNASRVSPREALAIVPQICDALQFAHDHGIVHRDIKPENILLDRRGRVKVADFGVAKIIASETAEAPQESTQGGPGPSLTEAGKIMGTPQYMSPEQVRAPGEVDHRADIYALGVVFYQMLTGELPGQNIEPPSRKVQIDVRLDEVVLRALAKKPELRYQQVSVLKTELETIATAAAETGEPEAAGKVPAAKPRALDVVIGLFLAAGLWSLWELLVAGGRGQGIRILPGVFAIPIGIGLLYRREFSRRIAIWSTWATFVWGLIFIAWLIGNAFGPRADLVVKVLGHQIGSPAGALLTFIFLGMTLVLLPWVGLVLGRRDVRNAFANPSPKPRPWLEWGTAAIGVLLMMPGLQLPLRNPLSTGIYLETRLPRASSASAETWTPALAPGEQPDISKIRDAIQERMNAGDYEGALQRQIWYFNHALQHGEPDPVRLSFGIMHWGELARRYPKARQALVEIRDQRVQEFATGGGYVDLFAEVQNLNRELGDPTSTYNLFRSIEHRDPKLAQKVYPYAEESLLAREEFATCMRYIGNPQERFDHIRQVRERTISILDRMPSHTIRMPNGVQPFESNLRRQADDAFIRSTLTLILVLVGVDRTKDAEGIQAQALEVLNDSRLQSAVAEATEKLATRRQLLSSVQFRWVARENEKLPTELLEDRRKADGSTKLAVLQEVLLDGSDVASSGFTTYRGTDRELIVFFKNNSRYKLYGATELNRQRQLALIWKNAVAGVVQVKSGVFDGLKIQLGTGISGEEGAELQRALGSRRDNTE